MLELSTPVKYVKGVGPRIADVLAGKGVYTVGDLLHYLPFRYEDRLNPRGISELRPGEMATIVAEVRNSGLSALGKCRFFNSPSDKAGHGCAACSSMPPICKISLCPAR